MSSRIVLGVIIVLLSIAFILAFTVGTDERGPDPVPDVPMTDSSDEQVDQSVTEDGETQSYTVEVIYRDGGFFPSTVEEHAGVTVRFVNESAGVLWVASDPHPAHSDLPEFDQGSGSGPGSSYHFTFENEGEWRYHNHLAPQHSGVIIIEGQSSE